MIYDPRRATVDGDNVEFLLRMAVRFEITGIIDKAESYLIRNGFRMPLHSELLLADKYKLEVHKEHCLYGISNFNKVVELKNSDSYKHYSNVLKAELMEKMVKFSSTSLVLPPPPTMPLAVEPAAAAVPAAGGTSTHTLTNCEAFEIMFKILSSNNNEYRLKPVFGFIEAGATAQVEITRLAGPPKEDKFVIQFAPAPEGAYDAQEAFWGATPAGDVTIPCKAE